jgi:hypothetical protein
MRTSISRSFSPILGFDEFMRYTSVPLGDPSSEKVSRDELKDCQHKGYVVYELRRVRFAF